MNSPHLAAKARIAQVHKLAARAKEFEEANTELLSKSHPADARILKGKNLALLDKLLTAIDTLVTGILSGCKLFGLHPKSHIVLEALRKPMIDEAELRKASSWITPMVIASTTGSGNKDMDEGILAETMSEVRQGWLTRPHS
jgi:hypothetical protein